MSRVSLFGYDPKKAYGVEAMPIEQEIALPEPVKQTRRNKIDMIDSCDLIIRMAQEMAEYVKRIPEDNDTNHAQLVQGLADKVKSARAEMELCVIYRG